MPRLRVRPGKQPLANARLASSSPRSRVNASYFYRPWPGTLQDMFLGFTVGYLIQPFTQRRQTLHDLIAGTVVVERDWAEWRQRAIVYAPPAPISPAKSFPGWAWFLVIVTTVAVVGSGGLLFGVVRPLRHRAEAAVTRVLADEIAKNAQTGSISGDRLELTGAEFKFIVWWVLPSTVTTEPTMFEIEAGVEIGSRLYYMETEITGAGLSFVINQLPVYRATPAIVDGRFVLQSVESEGAYRFEKSFVTERSFREAFEQGVNRALEAQGLRATSLELHANLITIMVEPDEEPS
jgi:hypothetical protein